MTTHVMFDLETAATSPTAAILSIGAVRFSTSHPYLHQEFKENVSLDSCKKEQMAVSADTIKWWDEQSKDAQMGLLRPQPMPIRRALITFNAWLRGVGEAMFIWARGTHFDVPIIENAFRTVGMPVPWHYREVRDLRTLETAAWAMGFREEQWAESFVYVAHDALQDAKAQGERAGRILELMYAVKTQDNIPKQRVGGLTNDGA